MPCACRSIALLLVAALVAPPSFADNAKPPIIERLEKLAVDLLASNKGNDEIAECLFVAALVRLPTDQEKKAVVKQFLAGANRKKGADDVVWALTNSKEFATVHKVQPKVQ